MFAMSCSLVAGCGLIRPSMDVDYDDQRLNDGLQSLVQHGESARLSDFTAWSWDEVHLFHEFDEREFIEKTVGAPVIKSNIYGSKASLLVFEDKGTPVKAIGVSGDYLRAQGHQVTWPATVVLTPKGTGFLEMTP